MPTDQLSESVIAYVGTPGRLDDRSPEERVLEQAGEDAYELLPAVKAIRWVCSGAAQLRALTVNGEEPAPVAMLIAWRRRLVEDMVGVNTSSILKVTEPPPGSMPRTHESSR